ncbi:E3 ubiquitin-protein ligase makorin-1 [Hypsizygus marmoreus]|uniref:E3 ubiquitin-protein ligase makorin-1 n=1 Tax=Hypsizygus marmoreus TaxID=39966 RepID=A0A369JM77_HYPMA|nr:E3 ubiquitin-protein ligase makorin-1 [Hypsizygus marmoreus]
MNDSQSHRPVTSKPRGICKYYTTPRGCFGGNSCKFLHTSDPSTDPSGSKPPALTPYDKAKRCRFYANGYCKRGESCWFLHVVDGGKGRAKDEDEDEELCSICFEKPSLYGLLGGCSHIFCLQCIRQWRDPKGKHGDVIESGNMKKCPMCRANSRYIIPSSRFWRDGQEGKEQVVQKYKESMRKVPCKHFVESTTKDPKKPMCPFGKDCFYLHKNDDGSLHVFKNGAEASMLLYRDYQRRGRRNAGFGFFNNYDVEMNFGIDGPFQVEFAAPPANANAELDVDAGSLAGRVAMDMFDRMVAEVMGSAMEEARAGGSGRGGHAARGTGRGGRRGGSRAGGRGGIDDATLDRARLQMVAGAVTAIRNELNRLEGPRNANAAAGGSGGTLTPVIIPGTATPTDWDLEGGGNGGADDAWGWNQFLTEGGNGDADVMERLEILADQMLGSLRSLGARDTGTPPPALEAIERGNTPPPPLEPIGSSDSDEEDDMPALQSVSNSSESDLYSDNSDEDRGEEYDEEAEGERVQNAMRSFDFAFNNAGGDEPRLPLLPLLRGQTLSAANRPPFGTSSSRFSNVVEREPQTMVIDIDEDEDGGEDEYEAEDERDEDVSELQPDADDAVATPSPAAATAPPFVTDGRGRVVWSNKGPEAIETPTETPNPRSTEETTGGSRSGPGSRSLFGRMFDALF